MRYNPRQRNTLSKESKALSPSFPKQKSSVSDSSSVSPDRRVLPYDPYRRLGSSPSSLPPKPSSVTTRLPPGPRTDVGGRRPHNPDSLLPSPELESSSHFTHGRTSVTGPSPTETFRGPVDLSFPVRRRPFTPPNRRLKDPRKSETEIKHCELEV